MSFQRLYPYTDAHEVNLDWILDRVSKIDIEAIQSVTGDVSKLKTDVSELEETTADLDTIRTNAAQAKQSADTAIERSEDIPQIKTDLLDTVRKNDPATLISYDPTESQLSAHNVQEAIDALVQSGGGGGGQASEVLYNNAESGLPASNVQRAIDVVAGKTYRATLATGETEINITDEYIDSNSTIDFYTSIYGVNPIEANVTGNTLSIVFDVQDEPIDVKVIVR